MKIVVTGALGHIGSRLIRELPQRFPEATIVMVDNLATQRYSSLFQLPSAGHYLFIEADVVEADLTPIFQGADAVVHLAAITDAATSFDRPEQVELVNARGTERVAQACVDVGSPLLFPSTTSVYGSQNTLVDETCGIDELQPQSPYAESKLVAEQLLSRLGSENGLRFVTCRFGTVFGTSVGMRFHTAVNKFCWQAVMGQPLTVWQTAQHQVRPYADLVDVVQAIEFIIDRELFDGQVYNVVTLNTSVDDILNMIRSHVPDLTMEFVESRVMNQLSYEVSSDRFRSAGFTVEGSMEQGIHDTIDWLRAARRVETVEANDGG